MCALTWSLVRAVCSALVVDYSSDWPRAVRPEVLAVRWGNQSKSESTFHCAAVNHTVRDRKGALARHMEPQTSVGIESGAPTISDIKGERFDEFFSDALTQMRPRRGILSHVVFLGLSAMAVAAIILGQVVAGWDIAGSISQIRRPEDLVQKNLLYTLTASGISIVGLWLGFWQTGHQYIKLHEKTVETLRDRTVERISSRIEIRDTTFDNLEKVILTAIPAATRGQIDAILSYVSVDIPNEFETDRENVVALRREDWEKFSALVSSATGQRVQELEIKLRNVKRSRSRFARLARKLRDERNELTQLVIRGGADMKSTQERLTVNRAYLAQFLELAQKVGSDAKLGNASNLIEHRLEPAKA